MYLRRTAAALILTACLDPAGLGLERVASAPPVDERNLFVYLLEDADGEGLGRLTPVTGSPFTSGGRFDDVESLSAAVARRLVFLGNSVTHTISVLQIDTTTGTLTRVPGSPFVAEGMAPAETAEHGSLLVVGNAGSATLSSFRVAGDGGLLRTAGSPVPTNGGLLEGMALDPAGRLVFVNDADLDHVAVFAVSASGTLTPVAGSPFGGVFLPDEVVTHPDGRTIFVTNRSQASISVFAVSLAGALTPISASPFAAPAGFTAYEHCVLTSDGTLLFAGFEIPPAVVAYHVAPDGSLNLVAGTPVLLGTPGPGGPEGMAVDPTNRLLVVTDHIADRLHVFAIDAGGGLTAVGPQGGVAVGAEPFDVIIPGWRVGGRAVVIVAARPR